MSFFKRKGENVIPPVEPEQKESTPPGYVGGGRNEGINTSRGAAQDPLRAQLFAGYNPENAGKNRFTASDRGPELPEPTPGEENDEDVEGIKQQIRTTKQESVNSTRNALRLAREAEETARGTLLKLGDQSGAFLSASHRYKDLIS
jgi:protein transport protein SEC9